MDDNEIKLRFDYISKDMGKLESAVNLLTATVAQLRPAKNWPNILTMLMIVAPLYALVIDLIVRGGRG